MSKEINLMIIGCGFQGDLVYLPSLRQLYKDGHDVHLKSVVDLESNRLKTEQMLQKHGFKNEETTFFGVEPRPNGKISVLTPDTRKSLEYILKTNNINAVILGTDPISRNSYLPWVQDQQIHIFSEKPLTALPHSTTDPSVADQIITDYDQAIKKQTDKVVLLNIQRRYQTAYHFLSATISDIFNKTLSPITSIGVIESDGQWRFPHEYFLPMTHSMIEGIGKGTFSGIHYIDIALHLLRNAQRDDLKINNAQVHTNIMRAYDTARTIDETVVKTVFNKQPPAVSESAYEELKTHGDVDIQIHGALMHDDIKVTSFNFQFQQSGNSQRSWFVDKNDPYNKLSRIKQKTVFLNQGPFMSTRYSKYRKNMSADNQGYRFGQKDHNALEMILNPIIANGDEQLVEMHFPSVKTSEGIEDCTYMPLKEFILGIENPNSMDKKNAPTLESFQPATILLCQAYKSAALDYQNEPSAVRFEFKL